MTTDWTAQPTPAAPRSAKGRATRERMIVAAAALFAAKGIDGVPPHEILEASGQRNASAIQYHFGSHRGLVIATLQPRPDIRAPIDARRAAILAGMAPDGGATTLQQAVRLWAEPVAILLDTPEGRAFLRVAVQVLRTLPLEHRVTPNQPSEQRVHALVHGFLASLTPGVAAERMGAAQTLMLELYANRARELEEGIEPNLDPEAFKADAVAMMVGLLGADEERAMADTRELPRIEDFRADLDPAAVAAGEAGYLRALATQGYLLAFPAFLHMRQLTEYLQGRRYMAPGEAPLGGWFLMRNLSDPTVTTVSPNVDTLYGASHLLLDRQGPVVLQVPAIPDRYYSVVCMDAYWNNVAIVSPRTFGDGGGEYLLVPPGWQGGAPEGFRAVIEAPTPSIVLLQRIFVRTPAEVEALHPVQDAIRLYPLARRGQPDARFDEVPLDGLEVEGMRMTRDPMAFFRLMNWYTGWNPPDGETTGIAAVLTDAGIGPGAAVPEDDASRAAILAGSADAQALIDARLTAGPIRNGWRVPDPRAGLAGPFIADRAVIQATAMGAFVNEEAMYFFAVRDGAGALLDGREAYTLRFAAGELPPLHEPGFWSLTMYDESAFLVANAIDRYSIRPDTPGLVHEADGSLALHLSATPPAGVPEGNWLPAPDGRFNVALRTYLPKQQIVDGAWFPPAIERTTP